MKLAAIDIGSNAIRLLIEEVHRDGDSYHIEKVSLTRVPVRLGEDVFTKGKIGKEKTRQLVKTMKAFWYLMDVHEVELFRACATSAMRDARNSAEIITRVHDEANVEIEILSGDEEADLIFSNYITQHLDKSSNFLYIDVGGGSTEITLIRGGKKIKSKSFELGTVRMLSAQVPDVLWSEVKRWLENSSLPGSVAVAIGTGGNINTLFKLQGKKPGEMITRDEIFNQYEDLKAHTLEQRITRMKLKPDRADVIIPACEIYLKLMDFAGISKMLVPKLGLADGIILDIFNDWIEDNLIK